MDCGTRSFPLKVFKALDVLGYNEKIVKRRRDAYDNLSKTMTTVTRTRGMDGCSVAVCGSKREGLSSHCQSDIDIMLSNENVLCCDNPAMHATDDVHYVCELCRDRVPSGYTKLKLVYRNTNKIDHSIESSLVRQPDKSEYLSSSLYMINNATSKTLKTGVDRILPLHRKQRAGPSSPFERENSPVCPIYVDFVRAFPCHCSEYLSSWTNRARKYKWPPKTLIAKATVDGAHVVPVGSKGSADENLQWRICYTHTEVDLMQSLNETQWKLYALLRMLKDDVFVDIGDVLTSYMLKNVIMWISEESPLEEFRPGKLLALLQKCLQFLLHAFQEGILRNYMISERNLLQGKLTDDISARYLAVLQELIKEGPAVVHRCTKLKKVLHENVTLESKQEVSKEVGVLFLYILPTEDYKTLLSTLESCSTLLEATSRVAVFLHSRVDQMANVFGVPVDECRAMLDRLRTMPQEQMHSSFGDKVVLRVRESSWCWQFFGLVCLFVFCLCGLALIYLLEIIL